ncbi:hypothetical protein M501DRAFT_1004577 [Patellaria atrata CBS 101060]|uniref:Uncharacterized protein n=1 Tax=Patellaria atrata CBS 101060 TaxID=1346257 RepID=A0A9P4S9Z1_9PEZI|nr:hypothetical protein M501DRAFT_1004577 [Patellaria atrata CBS 101060]
MSVNNLQGRPTNRLRCLYLPLLLLNFSLYAPINMISDLTVQVAKTSKLAGAKSPLGDVQHAYN